MADSMGAGSLEDRQLKLKKQRELMAKKQKQRQEQSGRINASIPAMKHVRPHSGHSSSTPRSMSSCECPTTQQTDSRSDSGTSETRSDTRLSAYSDDRPLISQQSSTESAPQKKENIVEKLAAAGLAASVECESSEDEDDARSSTRTSHSTQPLAVAPIEPTSRRRTGIVSRPEASPPESLDPASIGAVVTDGQITNLKDFVFRPAPENTTVKCRITRDKRGMGKHIYPIYYLYLECDSSHKLFLLAARKRKRSKSSNYLISIDATDLCRDGDSYVAKLRGNFIGTSFTVYDSGENPLTGDVLPDMSNVREELCAVVYETNVLGFKGPRKMTVLIPSMSHDKRRITVKPESESGTLLERYKSGQMVNISHLHNKQPQWSDDAHAFVLNFQGRVTLASVKNFQLVHPANEDYIVMQFGRIYEEEFTMDYNFPMSAVQAFAIALSSFDSKLACE